MRTPCPCWPSPVSPCSAATATATYVLRRSTVRTTGPRTGDRRHGRTAPGQPRPRSGLARLPAASPSWSVPRRPFSRPRRPTRRPRPHQRPQSDHRQNHRPRQPVHDQPGVAGAANRVAQAARTIGSDLRVIDGEASLPLPQRLDSLRRRQRRVLRRRRPVPARRTREGRRRPVPHRRGRQRPLRLPTHQQPAVPSGHRPRTVPPTGLADPRRIQPCLLRQTRRRKHRPRTHRHSRRRHRDDDLGPARRAGRSGEGKQVPPGNRTRITWS